MITSFALTKLHVMDIPKMEKFYCGCLGFEVSARLDLDEQSGNLEELMLTMKGGSTALNLANYRDRPAAPTGEAVIGLHVTDLDATVAAMVAAGGTVTVEPMDMPEHKLRLAFVSDPEGHWIELLEFS